MQKLHFSPFQRSCLQHTLHLEMWKFLTAFTGADKSIFPAIYLHHQVLAPSDELIFCVNNRLEKSEILQDNNLSELHLIGGKTIWAETWPRGQPCVACSDQPMNYYCRDIKYQTVRPSPSKTQLLSRPRWDGKIWLTGASDKLWWPSQAGKNIRKPKLFWTNLFWHFEI